MNNTDAKTPVEVADNLSDSPYISNDPHSDDDHKKMDIDLSEVVRTERPTPILLSSLVYICNTLNPKLTDTEDARQVLNSNVQVLTELQKACAAQNFKFVRRLKCLQATPSWIRSQVTLDEENIVKKLAWETPYVGNTPALLRDCVNDMNRNRRPQPYRNFTTVIQSSGTGKSRTVDEMAKLLFTLPFNLRYDSGYPLPDTNVRNLFKPEIHDDIEEEFEVNKMRYLLFFHSLFETVQKLIVNWTKRDTHEEFAEDWRNFLRDRNSAQRMDVYDKAIEAVPNDIYNMKQAIQLALASAQKLLTTVIDKSGEHAQPLQHRGPVRVFLYFDEATDLTRDSVDGEFSLLGRSPYLSLCSALNEFFSLDIFTVILSTKVGLIKHMPVKSLSSSARAINRPYQIQPPFVELPFDTWKEKYLVTENKHMLIDVCKVEYMVRFGRPLFWTRWEVGNAKANRDMIKFAIVKLRGGFMHDTSDGDLAALSIRLLLEFDSQWRVAATMENRLVAGHMRIAFSVPEHCEHMYSGAPSEPILAEAAAVIMKDMESAPKFLAKFVSDGLISKGERGELVARLLLTLAHDAAVDKLGLQPGLPSQPIRVVDFLGALFHHKWMASILNSQAQNVSGGQTLGESFKDAYIHFTHFSEATDAAMMADASMWFAMARGMAWKFCHRQYLTDMLIPILLWDAPLGQYVMSALAIQIRNRERWASKLKFFTQSNTDDKEQDNKINTRPYITLIMELDVQPRAVTETDSEKIPAKHPRYVIRAIGCSPMVYGVIKEEERDIYMSLLEERPRRKQQLKDALLHMKPVWGDSPASLDWFGAAHSEVTNAVPAKEWVEGVVVGDEAAERSDEELLSKR